MNESGRSGQPGAGNSAALPTLSEGMRALADALAQQPGALAQARSLFAAIQEQERGHARAIERALALDATSGLPNRTAFVRQVDGALADHIPTGAPAVVMVIGVRHLSTVRESLGHTVADELVQRLAQRVTDVLPHDAYLARVGDDALALFLETGRSEPEAAALARRLIEVIDSPVRVVDQDLRLIATLGLSVFPEDGTRAEMLLARAQSAMRFAREHGTRLYQYFDATIGRSSERRLRLEAELRRAIDRAEFRVRYQPRCRLRGGRIIGAEALLRWDHPERGMLDADEFIDVAIDTGLITPIGETVLRQACRDAAKWPRGIALAVNLSAREFRGARLETLVDRALADSGLAPTRLMVELTEASLQGDRDDMDVTLVRLTALRDRGVQLVLDNFGTGSGSLDLLRRCRAEHVKIGAQLIRGLASDADMHAVVRAIAVLARHFGATVIAEGIEDEAQRDAALRAGCSQGQGYFLGRPAVAAQIHEKLAPQRAVASARASAG